VGFPLINSTINYALHHRRPGCSLSRIIARLCGRALAAAAGTPLPSHAASLSHFITHALLLRPPPLTFLTPPNTRQTPLSYLPPTYDIFGVPPSSDWLQPRHRQQQWTSWGNQETARFYLLNQASATPPPPPPRPPPLPFTFLPPSTPITPHPIPQPQTRAHHTAIFWTAVIYGCCRYKTCGRW